MRWSRYRPVTVMALLLTVSSCFDGGSSPPASASPGSAAVPCTEADVGADPPATITIVASTTLDVPFQSWECPGLNADTFSTATDARLIYEGDGFEVAYSSTGELHIAGSIAGVTEERVNLSWKELAPGRVRVTLPSPGETWQVAIQIVTTDGRSARYLTQLEPRG